VTPLKIAIMSAKGLPPADANGKADPYCTCQVISQDTGKPQLVSMSQTKIHQKTLDPWWGFETDDRYIYQEGDSLLFEIFDYDQGDSQHDLLCRVVLPSIEFCRIGGFDGRLDCVDVLQGQQKNYNPQLKVKVTVNVLPILPSALKIHIIGAKGLPPADANGLADPFCVFQLTNKPFSRSSTKLKNKTLEPVWNEEFDDKHRYDDGDSLQFDVYDYDKGGKFDLMCTGELKNSAFADTGVFEGDLPIIPEEGGPYKPTLQLKVTLDRQALQDIRAAQAELEERMRQAQQPAY
jgi:Ca2+-dependent lipid-binding protein